MRGIYRLLLILLSITSLNGMDVDQPAEYNPRSSYKATPQDYAIIQAAASSNLLRLREFSLLLKDNPKLEGKIMMRSVHELAANPATINECQSYGLGISVTLGIPYKVPLDLIINHGK